MAVREMKDSGVEWIGAIPNDWTVVRLAYLADGTVNSFIDGDWIESPDISSEGIRYLTTGNIGDGCYKEQGNGYVSEEVFKRLKCKYAFSGDLIISRLNAPYGRSCILPDTFPHYVIAVDNVILRTRANKQFICYLTQCAGYQFEVENKARGTTMKRISRTSLGRIELPMPSIDEQNIIVNILDAKCAEIDSLTADIEKQIETLQEYKKSVIAEAVTKGLNPNVEMKDSGVEWVGKVPFHWKKVALKYNYAFEKGKNASRYTQTYIGEHEGSFPVYSGQTENDGVMGKIDTFDYDVGECLFSTTVGAKAMTVRLLSGKFSLSQNCLIMNKKLECVDGFFFYALNALFDYEKGLIPTYMQPSLRIEDLNGYKLFIPSEIKEQTAIAKFLDAKCSEIDSTVKEKQKQLETLVQYKQSLIYEYVTGKKTVPM